jgi:hypothetical protein
MEFFGYIIYVLKQEMQLLGFVLAQSSGVSKIMLIGLCIMLFELFLDS